MYKELDWIEAWVKNNKTSLKKYNTYIRDNRIEASENVLKFPTVIVQLVKLSEGQKEDLRKLKVIDCFKAGVKNVCLN